MAYSTYFFQLSGIVDQFSSQLALLYVEIGFQREATLIKQLNSPSCRKFLDAGGGQIGKAEVAALGCSDYVHVFVCYWRTCLAGTQTLDRPCLDYSQVRSGVANARIRGTTDC